MLASNMQNGTRVVTKFVKRNFLQIFLVFVLLLTVDLASLLLQKSNPQNRLIQKALPKFPRGSTQEKLGSQDAELDRRSFRRGSSAIRHG